ncbi:hypothetical protein M0811_08878 [Anaeramoeba ignava]|uniref:Uncharacterized protein n=1 Tax=Anaeramoeba ignava TaxID=1746090 RepID=A0A9Q0RAL6_ANAIG|nr:hypothetical protein M0811_08878 [Anaeramoeba ignava]
MENNLQKKQIVSNLQKNGILDEIKAEMSFKIAEIYLGNSSKNIKMWNQNKTQCLWIIRDFLEKNSLLKTMKILDLEAQLQSFLLTEEKSEEKSDLEKIINQINQINENDEFFEK